jgi:Flp pilus assembly protein TadD
VADTLGWIYYKKGLFQNALPLLEASVRGRSNSPEAHYHLGAAYYRLGDSTRAKEELRTALKLGQDFAGVDDARLILKGLGD